MKLRRCALPVVLTLVLAACGSADGPASSDAPADSSSSSPADTAEQNPGAETGSTDDVVDDPIESDAALSEPPGDGDGDLAFGLRPCEPDTPLISADPSFFRDQPVYVGNEQPIDEVRAWAEQQPGFEELWIDRDNNGWLVLGFTSDVDERQVDLESLFPDVGVAAAEVPHGMEELDRLRDEVFAVMTANGIPISGGASVPRGQVSVFVGVLDDATLSLFAEFADDPVCFGGVLPEDAVLDGPQPTEGEGWRLLAVERTGDSYRTGVATDAEQYAALWESSGVTADRPDVDFDTEIVIWFGAVYGSGCEIRMDAVVFDAERSIVHADFVIPGNPGACNSDANPEAYVVAVDRDALPAGRFFVQLSEQDPPRGVPEERTVVDADLTAPGAIATDEQIGGDDELLLQVDRGYVVGPGGVVEPGFPATFAFDVACAVDVVGPVNGVVWRAADPDRGPVADQAWQVVAEDGGVVFAEILIEVDPARMSLTANGVTESYVPAGSEVESECAE